MLIATSEICVADVDIYFVFCFLSFCIMDVDVRFRKLCCGCRHPFRLFFCITYVDFCFRKLCCGCRHPFRNLFLFSVLRMSTPASENCVTDVDIHFVTFVFWFFFSTQKYWAWIRVLRFKTMQNLVLFFYMIFKRILIIEINVYKVWQEKTGSFFLGK